MAKAQKTVSIRLEADDYNFLNSLAEAEREDLSTAVRDLIGRGRVLLALER
jgi:predicted DNA-binding protein